MSVSCEVCLHRRRRSECPLSSERCSELRCVFACGAVGCAHRQAASAVSLRLRITRIGGRILTPVLHVPDIFFSFTNSTNSHRDAGIGIRRIFYSQFISRFLANFHVIIEISSPRAAAVCGTVPRCAGCTATPGGRARRVKRDKPWSQRASMGCGIRAASVGRLRRESTGSPREDGRAARRT